MSGLFDKLKAGMDKLNGALAESQNDYSWQNSQDQNEVVPEVDAHDEDIPEEKLCLLLAEYLGGYEDAKGGVGSLVFYEDRIEFSRILSTHFTIDNEQVKAIAIEGKDEIGRRVTATRLIALGVFSLAFQKKTREKQSYLTLELVDGQEVIFFMNNIAPMELKAKLSKVRANLRNNSL